MATLNSVARAAGVSRQTVSNVLNSPEIVKPATRERVERAIADLGYRPHAAARRLRTQRSMTIGIRLYPYAGGISGVVLDRFVHALTDRASERGMRILVFTASDMADETRQIGELADAGEIDAVVVTATTHDDTRVEWLNQRGLPYALFGRPWGSPLLESEATAWVDIDGAAGTRAATEHFLRLSLGPVGFLGWPAGSGSGDDRERGWRNALDAAGLRGPRLTADNDLRTAQAVVSRWLATPSRPELGALVCVSDELAIGAHLALNEAGLRDFPLVGFDNTPAAEALGLSSVEQEPEYAAGSILSLLMGPREGETIPSPPHLLVEPQLIVR